MTTQISGTTGVSQIQDNTVTSAKIVDGSVTRGDTSLGASPSMIRVNTPNGYGSTNTVIPRFANVTSSVGSDIVYADSATLGASFTIQTTGVYAISFSANPAGAYSLFGASKNSTLLTTSIVSVPSGDRLFLTQNDVATSYRNAGGTFLLTAGDIIRPHHDAVGITSVSEFTIVRVA